MIRYALRCTEGHRFDSWFGSSADFDRLASSGLVACAVCGGTRIEKDLMAPSHNLRSPREAADRGGSGPDSGPDSRPDSGPDSDPDSGPGPLSAPASPAEQALAELRRRIEATAEDVGGNFATEARRIHDGEAPVRPIYGEARPSDARALIEDGIPVAPLPWPGRGKGN